MKPAAPGSPALLAWFPGVLALALWVAPVAYTGLSGRFVPRAGKQLNYHWRIAPLFPRRSHSWSFYFYEVLPEGGEWTELPQESLGRMEPFGFGNRVHRIMAQGGGDRNRPKVLEGVAWFVKNAYERQHPDDGSVQEVRFRRWRLPAGSPQLVDGHGPPVAPSLGEVPRGAARVWARFGFDESSGSPAER